jgi:hypothetical protein
MAPEPLPSMKAYLAGSIQASSDGGVAWRRTITPLLEKLGIVALDPTIYEAKELGNPESVKETISECVAAENWERFDHLVDLLIDRDKRLVEEANMVVAYYEPSKQSAGTISEIWHAVIVTGIPVYVVSYSPLKEWSYWLLRVIRRHGRIFSSWTELVDFLGKTYGEREVKIEENKTVEGQEVQ